MHVRGEWQTALSRIWVNGFDTGAQPGAGEGWHVLRQHSKLGWLCRPCIFAMPCMHAIVLQSFCMLRLQHAPDAAVPAASALPTVSLVVAHL